MLNFLGPLRKYSAKSKSASSPPPPPTPPPSPPSSTATGFKNEEGEEKAARITAVANSSSVLNGDLLRKKLEFRNEVGANGTLPGGAGVAIGVDGEPHGKSELEELKERADEVTNESTRRMAEFCEQAKDAGIKIIVALDDQKEQLDRIQDSLTTMREDLIQADTNIRGMEKCCGIFNNPFKKSTFKEDENLWKDAGDGVVMDNSSPGRRPFIPNTGLSWPLNKSSSSHNSSKSSPGPGGCGVSGGYISRITEDKAEEEMDKNMDLVSSMLGNLRNMAIDMNTEIESQNKQMNIINDMTEKNNERIDDAIQRTHDLKH